MLYFFCYKQRNKFEVLHVILKTLASIWREVIISNYYYIHDGSIFGISIISFLTAAYHENNERERTRVSRLSGVFSYCSRIVSWFKFYNYLRHVLIVKKSITCWVIFIWRLLSIYIFNIFVYIKLVLTAWYFVKWNGIKSFFFIYRISSLPLLVQWRVDPADS